jgi:nucleotide-binding universal stress UspA family protein
MSSNPMNGERLVCGLDDSDAAANVLATATALAAALGLRLTLVHSPHPDLFLAACRRRAALRRGQALLARLAADVPAADRVVEIGDPVVLLRAVLEDRAALAVIGSRGRGAARAALLGSVSHELARCAPCPLVVVPPRATLGAAAGAAVVCGVDGSPTAAAALEVAGTLAGALRRRLVAVYVRSAGGAAAVPATWAADRTQAPVDDGHAALAVMRRAVADLDPAVPVSLRVESGDPAERLLAVARERPFPILAIGSRGQRTVRAALLGSVSSRLAAIAPAPVIIVSPAAQREGSRRGLGTEACAGDVREAAALPPPASCC